MTTITSPTLEVPDPVRAEAFSSEAFGLDGQVRFRASDTPNVERGLAVEKSFGRKYVEFATPSSPVKLALYGQRSHAKLAGVPAEGAGEHGSVIGNAAGSFTDPDAFAWEETR